MGPPVEQVTEDGYDMQFGTNCLGPWYFTKLLIPTLLETAKTVPPHTVRVVTTSSSGSIFWNRSTFDWDSLQRGEKSLPARKKIGEVALYFQSKFVRKGKRTSSIHSSVLYAEDIVTDFE